MKKIILLCSFCLFLFGCEQKGIVDVDDLDCAETILLEEGDWATYTKKFTCLYEETEKKDVIRGGLCSKIEMTKENKCRKAYIYTKAPTIKCPKNSELEYSGNCECISKKYEWNKRKTACTEKKCQKNAKLFRRETKNYWEDAEYDCVCNDGYTMSKNKKSCLNEKERALESFQETIQKQKEENQKQESELSVIMNHASVYEPYYNFNINYPQFREEALEKLNEEIKNFSASVKEDLVTTDWESGFYDQDPKHVSILLLNEIIRTPKTISVIFDFYTYTGGAHGIGGKKVFNFNTDNKKMIKITNLTEKYSDFLKKASNYSYLKLLINGISFDWTQSGTEATEENFENFSMQEGGIKFYFNPYQVAPYSAGIQDVFIEFDIFEKDL